MAAGKSPAWTPRSVRAGVSLQGWLVIGFFAHKSQSMLLEQLAAGPNQWRF
jgi:hypothetical protein